MTDPLSTAYRRRMRSGWSLVPLLAAFVVMMAACAGHHASSGDLSVHIPADLPSASASWPPYPHFPTASCWARALGGGPLRSAPSTPVTDHSQPVAPETIVKRVLARFGDRRYVLRVELGPPPPITLQHLRGYYAGVRPPKNALWAYVAAPVATRQLPNHAGPQASGTQMVADWETHLVIGALRDDFCAAGGRPLVGWTVGQGGIGVSDQTQALEQRFPNPTPAAFRHRVELVGRRYGFTAEELRLLHPRQLAPLLVVHTERDRKAFVADVPKIMRLLDPVSTGSGGASAITFEGFFFAAVAAMAPSSASRTSTAARPKADSGRGTPATTPTPIPNHSRPTLGAAERDVERVGFYLAAERVPG